MSWGLRLKDTSPEFIYCDSSSNLAKGATFMEVWTNCWILIAVYSVINALVSFVDLCPYKSSIILCKLIHKVRDKTSGKASTGPVNVTKHFLVICYTLSISLPEQEVADVQVKILCSRLLYTGFLFLVWVKLHQCKPPNVKVEWAEKCNLPWFSKTKYKGKVGQVLFIFTSQNALVVHSMILFSKYPKWVNSQGYHDATLYICARWVQDAARSQR